MIVPRRGTIQEHPATAAATTTATARTKPATAATTTTEQSCRSCQKAEGRGEGTVTMFWVAGGVVAIRG